MAAPDKQEISTTDPDSAPLRLRTVGMAAPWHWLALGLRDVRRAWGVALFYGLCFWGMALLLGGLLRQPALHHVGGQWLFAGGPLFGHGPV